MPAAQQCMSRSRSSGNSLAFDDADVERVGRPAVAAEAMRGNERAQHLLVVGVDDDGRLHHRPYLGGEWGLAKAVGVTRAHNGRCSPAINFGNETKSASSFDTRRLSKGGPLANNSSSSGHAEDMVFKRNASAPCFPGELAKRRGLVIPRFDKSRAAVAAAAIALLLAACGSSDDKAAGGRGGRGGPGGPATGRLRGCSAGQRADRAGASGTRLGLPGLRGPAAGFRHHPAPPVPRRLGRPAGTDALPDRSERL